MKARPLIMTANNAQKVHVGTKTQTRRIVKLRNSKENYFTAGLYHPRRVDRHGEEYPAPKRYGIWGEDWDIPCPFGMVEDRLWIKEPHYLFGHWRPREYTPTQGVQVGNVFVVHRNRHVLFPDNRPQRVQQGRLGTSGWYLRNAVYMPRWACRTVVEIADLRVERVQDITEVDAIAEGIQKSIGGMWCGAPHHAHGAPKQFTTASEAFMDLWRSIHGPTFGTRNPWVWVITFRRVAHAPR